MRKPKSLFRERARSRSGAANASKDRRNPNDVRYVSMHEAGHAVAAVILGWPLRSVDIMERVFPNGRLAMGFTDTERVAANDLVGKGEEAALPHIVQALAGPTAEALVNDRVLQEGAATGDLEAARQLAFFAIGQPTFSAGRMEITASEVERCQEQVAALFHRAALAATQLVNANVDVIRRVARALVERHRLTGDEVASLMKAS